MTLPVPFDRGEFHETEIDIGESGCRVFRLDPVNGGASCYAKVGAGTFAEAVADEHRRLQWLQGRLPVPQILTFDRNVDTATLITSEITGHSVCQLLEGGTVDPVALIDTLADFMRIIHDLPSEECPFVLPLENRLLVARERIDLGLVDEADFDDERLGQTAADVWKELHSMLPFSSDSVVTHGDFSLDNILFDGERVSGCIDVGLVGVADRHQDIGIFWADLGPYGTALQSHFLDRYGRAQVDPRKLHFYVLLNELF